MVNPERGSREIKAITPHRRMRISNLVILLLTLTNPDDCQRQTKCTAASI
jgi:hypothetical protein